MDNWDTLLEDPGVSNGGVGVANGLLVFPWALWQSRQFEMRGFDLTAPQQGAFLVAPAVFSRQFWVNDTELLYVDEDQVLAIPLFGGETRSLLGVREQSDVDATLRLTTTEDEFFWVQSDRLSGTTARTWGAFRQRRSAGLPQRFGTIDAAEFEPEQVVRTDEGLLVTGGERSVILPLEGGEPFWLAPLQNAGSAGADEEGVYAEQVRNPERGIGEQAKYELRQAPAKGGAVQVLWRGPQGRRLENLQRYGRGWIAAGWDTFGDGPHAALFWLSDSGSESYLGCGPVGSRIRSPTVVDNGMVYFSAGDSAGPRNRGQTRWLIRVGISQ